MPQRKLFLILMVIAVMTSSAGCTSPTVTVQPMVQPTSPPATPAASPGPEISPSAQPITEARVSLQNFAFIPETVTITAPENVTWTNDDGSAHTIAFAGEQATPLGPGESYTRTFETPGTYDYVCSIHPSMKGKVIVQ